MAKTCRIYETLNSVKEMKVEKKDGLMTLSGTFGVCGVRNNNKRVYETSNYGARVKELQAQINENGGVPGELEHPDSMNINLENISHKVTKIDINNEGVVSGEIQLLNTPKGKIAQAIVEGGLPLFVSSRATGNVGKDGMVTLEKLCTYDLVGTPGFSQARMHLNESQLFESLSDNIVMISDIDENDTEGTEVTIEENNNEDMEIKEILERLEELENKVNVLEEQNESLQEELNEARENKLDIKKFAEGVEKWVVEEFAPEIQNWVMEEFVPEQNKTFRSLITEKLAPAIEKWIVEEYSPEVEKWVVEQYSPEVEKWVVEQYSPEVQNWFCEQVAPAVQNWIIEQYAPEVENWMNECYSKKVEGMVSEKLENTKTSKLQSITETLALLESMEPKKPTFGGNVINENVVNEPLYIQNMPERFRPQYNMASQELKESIARRAKIYDFTNEGAIERFWEKIDFNAQPVEPLNENLDRYEDERERQIRSMFRRNRRF